MPGARRCSTAGDAVTFALWMILAAAMLPYLTVGAAKFSGPGYDNAAPRQWTEGLQGWRRRMEWAHRNHFEAFPAFAAAVLVSHVTGVSGTADWLAGAYVVLRLGYTAAYATNRPALRSVLWLLALGCVVGLFITSSPANGAQ